MAVYLVLLVTLLAMAGHSDASYCICDDGLSDKVYQTNIDYACGSGADCTPIQLNGPCFQPNTVKDHCNYAVNSYYQRKGQAVGSCSFSNTAQVSQNPPSAASGCVYPSSPSNAGTPSTTPGGSPNTGGTPNTGGSPTPTNGGTTNPGGTTTVPGGTGGTMTPGLGLGPTTGTGFPNTDGTGHATTLLQSTTSLITFFVSLLVLGLLYRSV